MFRYSRISTLIISDTTWRATAPENYSYMFTSLNVPASSKPSWLL